jgi:hypothetical protein
MGEPFLPIDPEDHAWLMREARLRRLPLAEFARQVFRAYREQSTTAPVASIDDLLARTSGTWREGDGLAWQERLRDEMSR